MKAVKKTITKKSMKKTDSCNTVEEHHEEKKIETFSIQADNNLQADNDLLRFYLSAEPEKKRPLREVLKEKSFCTRPAAVR